MTTKLPVPVDTRMRVGQVELNVTDWGGDGDTIFFAHPTGFFGKIWKPVIDRIRAAGFGGRIFTFDQRGQGMSCKHDEGYAWRDMAHDTVDLLDALGVGDAVGVGHSAGATFVACAGAARPGSFRRLVLIDPILVGSLAKHSAKIAANNSVMARKTRTRRLVYESRKSMFEAFRDRPPYDTWTDESLHVYVDLGSFDRPDGTVELLCPGRIEAQLYEGALEIDPIPELAKLNVPVLLVAGAHSDTFREPVLSTARDALHDHRYVVVQDATHFVPMEYPDKTAEMILAECRA
jgi:pimeloyl-ACP methyl ester carboxylesterase